MKTNKKNSDQNKDINEERSDCLKNNFIIRFGKYERQIN